MNKIAKVIDDCKDCEHCAMANGSNDNYTHFAVCINPGTDPFLLAYERENLRHFTLKIPAKCPLENYKNEDNPQPQS